MIPVNDCLNCVNYRKEPHAEVCAKENRMPFNQFEDYFIDKVVKCPYFKRKEERENGTERA